MKDRSGIDGNLHGHVRSALLVGIAREMSDWRAEVDSQMAGSKVERTNLFKFEQLDGEAGERLAYQIVLAIREFRGGLRKRVAVVQCADGDAGAVQAELLGHGIAVRPGDQRMLDVAGDVVILQQLRKRGCDCVQDGAVARS